MAINTAFKIGRLISRNKRLPILTYHRVLDEKDPYRPAEPDTKEFSKQLEFIGSNFRTYRLTDAVEKLINGTLPDDALCITFDDGYKDNLENATKLLLDKEMVATFFITTGYLGNGCMWNDLMIDSFKFTDKEYLDLSNLNLGKFFFSTEREKIVVLINLIKRIKYYEKFDRDNIVMQIREKLGITNSCNHMMTESDVQQIHRLGMEIGAHTVSHPILLNESSRIVKKEVADGKKHLEDILMCDVTAFAYPNGKYKKDYDNEVRDIVEKCGFRCAVTTERGVATRNSDIFQMNRLTLWGNDSIKRSLRFIKNVYLSK